MFIQIALGKLAMQAIPSSHPGLPKYTSIIYTTFLFAFSLSSYILRVTTVGTEIEFLVGNDLEHSEKILFSEVN